MTTNKISLKQKKYNIFAANKDSITCYILSLVVFALIIAIISNPTKYNASIMQGLNLFIVSVLPGLFPFMFLTKLLTSLGAVKHLSTKLSPITHFLFNTHGISSYVFIMSILSGYPIGAKLISDLYSANIISQNDAKKMCTFCTTSGPIFIIGSVGATMFGSARVGIILYLSHILSSILCGIIFAGKRQNNNIKPQQQTHLTLPDNALSNTMLSTVENILLVGGYITIFFLLIDILTSIGLLGGLTKALDAILSSAGINTPADGLVSGLLEVTRGCKMLSGSISIWNICFACFIISFSGLSIILQSMNYLSKCKIKARYFMFVKCVHAVLSFIVCFVMCLIINPF